MAYEICESCFKPGRGMFACPHCDKVRKPWSLPMRFIWLKVSVLALAGAGVLAWKRLGEGFALQAGFLSLLGVLMMLLLTGVAFRHHANGKLLYQAGTAGLVLSVLAAAGWRAWG